MYQIVIISNLSGLPLKSNIFKLIYSEASSRHSFDKNIINTISIDFILKSEVIAFLRGNL